MSIESQMNQAIEDAISKELPAAVGEVLKKRLAQADDDSRALQFYKREYESMLAKIGIAEKQIAEFGKQEAALYEREKVVAQREKTADYQQLQLTCEKEKVVLVQDMFRTVFQNRITRESVMTPMKLTQDYTQSGGGKSEYVEDHVTTHTVEEER